MKKLLRAVLPLFLVAVVAGQQSDYSKVEIKYDFDQKSFIIYGVGQGTVAWVCEGTSEPLK
jgi:hypothetical protein